MKIENIIEKTLILESIILKLNKINIVKKYYSNINYTQKKF